MAAFNRRVGYATDFHSISRPSYVLSQMYPLVKTAEEKSFFFKIWDYNF